VRVQIPSAAIFGLLILLAEVTVAFNLLDRIAMLLKLKIQSPVERHILAVLDQTRLSTELFRQKRAELESKLSTGGKSVLKHIRAGQDQIDEYPEVWTVGDQQFRVTWEIEAVEHKREHLPEYLLVDFTIMPVKPNLLARPEISPDCAGGASAE
jgi:hypothetical protein